MGATCCWTAPPPLQEPRGDEPKNARAAGLRQEEADRARFTKIKAAKQGETIVTQSKKNKRIVSIVARNGAIALAPYLDTEDGIDALEHSSQQIYAWLVNSTENEVRSLSEAGKFADYETISIKYQAAVNALPLYMQANPPSAKVSVNGALRLAERFYRISDDIENAETLAEAEAAFEEAARTRAEQTGMPYPNAADDLYPGPTEDHAAEEPPAHDADPIEAADAAEGQAPAHSPMANERQSLIARMTEAGDALGYDAVRIDEMIAGAETTYPGKSSVAELSNDELAVLVNSMDTAILRRDTAKTTG